IELIVDPPPDRPIDDEVRVTPRPAPTRTSAPEPTPVASLAPGAPAPLPTASPSPMPSPTPVPQRVRVDVNLYKRPDARFITEFHKDWCAVAGTQMVLAAHGKAALTQAFQRKLASRVGEWESRRDSINGEWGPSAMVKALDAYGVPGYEVRIYETRADALRDAARAISKFNAPVILLAWRGAHTWVMTGYRADGDPLLFDDVKVAGAYILDPWYPRVSSIWGPSDPPGTYQDAAEMRRNYLPWKRPEGKYPTRDGLFVAVVPTVRLDR
ncbi:MAG: C39 family peptidase, partial [Chloroflexi bacterium]|nr:C39 family peptidase [Chloroflexota bacterium]